MPHEIEAFNFAFEFVFWFQGVDQQFALLLKVAYIISQNSGALQPRCGN
jgi:hypothetical protein